MFSNKKISFLVDVQTVFSDGLEHNFLFLKVQGNHNKNSTHKKKELKEITITQTHCSPQEVNTKIDRIFFFLFHFSVFADSSINIVSQRIQACGSRNVSFYLFFLPFNESQKRGEFKEKRPKRVELKSVDSFFARLSLVVLL